jgi:hypothetical protein
MRARTRLRMGLLLLDDNTGDRDRDQRGQGYGLLGRDEQSEKWHGYQGFAKTECRPNQRGEKDHGKHENNGPLNIHQV